MRAVWLLFLGSALVWPTAADVSAFPGATGFGTSTPAGRGGTIYRVTNLATSGPGSLKACVAATGPRVCIFEVSGTIQLTQGLSITHPYLTIAGQTAPSPGITLRGQRLAIGTHDVLIRHIRVRPGDENGGQPQGIIVQNTGNGSVYNVVIDHCSISWAIDENLTTWGYADDRVHDVTFSNLIVGEALNDSTHPEGPHSKGQIIGDGNQRIAIVGNLFAHNADRNPEMKGGATVVVANNLIYNWTASMDATTLGRDEHLPGEPTLASVVGNVYLRGPDTALPEQAHAIETLATIPAGTKIHIADNLAPDLIGFRNNAPFDPLVATPPLWIDGWTALPASAVEQTVLASAGARPLDRDAVDLRIVGTVVSRTGRIIDSQNDVGGWPTLAQNSRPLTVPTNPHADPDGDGFTRLEDWLHMLALELEQPPGAAPDPVQNLHRTDNTVDDPPS
jgi:pectate lyase